MNQLVYCLTLLTMLSTLNAQNMPNNPQPQQHTLSNTQQSQQDAPQRDEKITLGVMIASDYAATLADAISTNRSQATRMCHESNPEFGGPHPSSARVLLQATAETTALSLASYWLMRHNHHWWPMLLGPEIIIHATATAHNVRYCL